MTSTMFPELPLLAGRSTDTCDVVLEPVAVTERRSRRLHRLMCALYEDRGVRPHAICCRRGSARVPRTDLSPASAGESRLATEAVRRRNPARPRVRRGWGWFGPASVRLAGVDVVRLPESLYASVAGVFDDHRVAVGPVLWVLPEEVVEVVVPSGTIAFWPPGLRGTRCVAGVVRGPAPETTVMDGAHGPDGRAWLVAPDLSGGRLTTDPEVLVEAVCTALSRRAEAQEEGLSWPA